MSHYTGHTQYDEDFIIWILMLFITPLSSTTLVKVFLLSYDAYRVYEFSGTYVYDPLFVKCRIQCKCLSGIPAPDDTRL